MKKVAIVAGGNSGEYEISLLSAQNIYNILDKELFTPYLIKMKEREWNFTDINGKVYSIDKNDFSLQMNGKKILFDVVFIAIHGTPGEDGKLQGYFDMLKIPYTGSDLFTSALTFNKYFCNLIVAQLGVPTAPSVHFYHNEKIDEAKIISTCGFPCFVKPCNSGSSVGVTKAHNKNELLKAIKTAFNFDNQILIEKFISGKELTCGVISSNNEIIPLIVTEITSKNEFYDFQSKYTDNLHAMITPAPINDEVRDKILKYSKMIFQRLGCKGVTRIDYILSDENIPHFLEINTVPGQTAMSIVPHQIQFLGKNLKDTYTEIINNAFQ